MKSRPGPANHPGLAKCSSRVMVFNLAPTRCASLLTSRLPCATVIVGIVAEVVPTVAAKMKSRRFMAVLGSRGSATQWRPGDVNRGQLPGTIPVHPGTGLLSTGRDIDNGIPQALS